MGEVSKCGQYTRIIGRKRVVTPHTADDLPFTSPINTSFKRRPKRRSHSETLNRLELLPQDVLIHVLCGVNHSNLKHVIFVSKAIHDAALIAKESHFDFSTPNSKLTKLTAKGDNIEDVNELDDGHETPNAPMRVSGSRLGCKDLSSITVALFTSPDETCS